MNLPQLRTLAELTGALGVPVQIGGSFARGEVDEVSDLDLTFEPPDGWTIDSLGGLLVAVQVVRLGSQTLYHGVAQDGTVVDLIPGPPSEGARNAIEFATPVAPTFVPSPLETGVLADYWIHTHKHAKPISRGLEGLAVLGLAHDRIFLMRLWSLASGEADPGANLGGIHAMSPLVKRLITPERQALLGMPVRDLAELWTAIEAIRDEVVSLGLPGADRIAAIVRATSPKR